MLRYRGGDGSWDFLQVLARLVESLVPLGASCAGLRKRIQDIARKWHEAASDESKILLLAWRLAFQTPDAQLVDDEPETIALILGRMISMSLWQLISEGKLEESPQGQPKDADFELPARGKCTVRRHSSFSA